MNWSVSVVSTMQSIWLQQLTVATWQRAYLLMAFRQDFPPSLWPLERRCPIIFKFSGNELPLGSLILILVIPIYLMGSSIKALYLAIFRRLFNSVKWN
jgi:hypothetical protein